jgi:hypothetical protein
MPRRHALTTHLHALNTRLFTSFLVLLITAIATIIVTITVNAQSNIPTKLAVSSPQRTVGVRAQIELRIRLLDQSGNETAATYDTNVTLIATRQKDIDIAKRDVQGNASFQRHGTLALPQGVRTIQTAVTIRKGESAAAVRFSSEQVGAVRIYAENEKLVTGAMLIAIVERSGKASYESESSDSKIFRLASFQETHPPATAAAAAECRLEIEPGGVTNPELNDRKEYVRKFMVSLKRPDGSYCFIPQNIKVRLRVVSGAAELSESVIVIPRDEVMYPSEIEVRTKTGGNIEASAMPVRGSDPVRAAAAVVFNFPTTIRATKLQVQAIPLVAMANGVESIKLRIRPVDAGNNPVRNEDEGMEVRNVTLSLASRTLGLRFENGATTIPIKRGEAFIETSIISSYPVAGARVVAEAENGDQRIISGEQKLEFCFPWTQLGGAMLGGLMFPLVLTVFPGKKREQRFDGGKLKMISKYGVGGLFFGALAFALVFFGALGLTEFDFNGIPITIARLPIHNVLAACAIGFFGSVMLASGIALTERAQDEPSAGESPARA